MLGKREKALNNAIAANNATAVTAIATKLKLGRKKEFYEACVAAVEHGASEALDALMQAGGGFNFNSRSFSDWDNKTNADRHTKNRTAAIQLIEKAYASPQAESLLPVLYKNNARENLGRYSGWTVEAFLKAESPLSLLEAHLKNDDSYSYSVFEECIVNTGLFSTDKLAFILGSASRLDARALARALCTVAGEGDIEKAALLLAKEANANYDRGNALYRAAINNHQDMVDLLLPHTSLAEHGCTLTANLQHMDADPAIVDSIRTATQKALLEAAAEISGQKVPQQDGFRRIGADTLEEVQSMPGYTLTTRFNFKSEKQEVCIDNGSTGNSITTRFDALDEGLVDAMREKFDSLGEPAPQKARKNSDFKQLRNAIR